MFFVVYLRALKKNVILPAEWILDIENHLEKFINNSINRSQKFLCYYTSNDAAFLNGCPDADFKPNFSLAMITENSIGAFDGCFIGKLNRFFCKYFTLN